MEEWKDIVITKNGVTYDFTGLYLVSNTGKVYSVKRSRCLKTGKMKNGYVSITIKHKGKTNHFLVHRLVATAFLPNPDNLPEVNHKDENRDNNNIHNLEWCTREYNNNYGNRLNKYKKSMKHKYNHQNENNPKAKKVMCIETGQIFLTIKEANSWLRENKIKGNVYPCVQGKAKTAGGHHWEYVDENRLD